MEDCSSKALSTLSKKSETVAENGETTATVSLFCDSVDCGQALRMQNSKG